MDYYKKDAKEYREAIHRLGLTQIDAARELGIDPRTSRRYALGECRLPPTVAKLLELMLQGQAKDTKRPVRVRS